MNAPFDPYSVPCPWCEADVGEPCRTVVGSRFCARPHANRQRAAGNQDPAPSTDEAVNQPVQEDTHPMNTNQTDKAIDACIAGVIQAQAQPHVDKAMALVERTKPGQGIRIKGGPKAHPWYAVFLRFGVDEWVRTEQDDGSFNDREVVTRIARALMTGLQVRRMAVK